MNMSDVIQVNAASNPTTIGVVGASTGNLEGRPVVNSTKDVKKLLTNARLGEVVSILGIGLGAGVALFCLDRILPTRILPTRVSNFFWKGSPSEGSPSMVLPIGFVTGYATSLLSLLSYTTGTPKGCLQNTDFIKFANDHNFKLSLANTGSIFDLYNRYSPTTNKGFVKFANDHNFETESRRDDTRIVLDFYNNQTRKITL